MSDNPIDPILGAIADLRTDFLAELGKTRAEIMDRIERVESELGTLHDDGVVTTAIAMRIDGTMTGLTREIRAMHAQAMRLANRVTALEPK